MNERIFSGCYPCGIVWSDRKVLKCGDYKKLAFMPYRTLRVELAPDCPRKLAETIVADAAKFEAMRGQQFQVTTAGQTVTLGK